MSWEFLFRKLCLCFKSLFQLYINLCFILKVVIKSGLCFIFAGLFLQESNREVTHQSLVQLLEKCNISTERKKEKQLSLSSDWLSLSSACEKEFKVDDDFLARCASFFGNKDIKVTW